MLCQDTSDPRHFGMSGEYGTSAEVSRPPANIFATIGRTEERFNITGYYYSRGPLVYTRIHRWRL